MSVGVLLFVMLLGMFPYDHESHPDPNSSAAHVEVFLEQQQYSWRQTPRVASHAAKLSESCRDLLDKVIGAWEMYRSQCRCIVGGCCAHMRCVQCVWAASEHCPHVACGCWTGLLSVRGTRVPRENVCTLV